MKKTNRWNRITRCAQLGLVASSLLIPNGLRASSHMDAPLITLDPAANTADVYAFLSQGNVNNDTNKYLITALSVYPFQEPGIGPNKYNFDDNVLYAIHVATTNVVRGQTNSDVALGRATFTYYFNFTTTYKTSNTILQSYLGVITNVGDAAQNLTQTYKVTKYDYRTKKFTALGTGIVPPNNQGNATPFYNQGDNGENPAKGGVTTTNQLDQYTAQSIAHLSNDYLAFAGQRDDGFYGDIQAIFDLLTLRSPAQDAQKGFNLHTIVLQIPLSELGSDLQVVGVYATTYRKQVTILKNATVGSPARFADGKPFSTGGVVPTTVINFNVNNRALGLSGNWIQVGRQGNPLFCEALIAIKDKDLYNRTTPLADKVLFNDYALNPELASLLNALVFHTNATIDTNRTDIAGIFIPDVIKVDLSTGPARLTGASSDDSGFSRLSIFGGDVLTSQVQTGFFNNGTVPGGWPNGRRFGDDVVDIAVTALASDLRNPASPTVNGPYGDNVDGNDITYNKSFPYAATPHNGRNHVHH